MSELNAAQGQQQHTDPMDQSDGTCVDAASVAKGLEFVSSRPRNSAQKEYAYHRHVFFPMPHAVSHVEAMIKLTAKQSVPDSFHAEHTVARDWRDSDIDRVVDIRAGPHDKARKR